MQPHQDIPHSLFSSDLERQTRLAMRRDVFRSGKRMVAAFYLIDVLSALARAAMHAALWVPAIVLWPLLLSSNGLSIPDVMAWAIRAGGGGWDGALLKLTAAVFVASMAIQLLRGSFGLRLRKHIDRRMERSLLWTMLSAQLPEQHARDAAAPQDPQAPAADRARPLIAPAIEHSDVRSIRAKTKQTPVPHNPQDDHCLPGGPQ